jgi:formate hydrogenlyase transcriptional activator
MSSSLDAFGARILIVDDQDSNVRLLEFALRRGGYLFVTSTMRGDRVCDLHRAQPYDLILLDLQMPRMNGFEVLAALANEAPVAVLVLSADPRQEAQSLAAGATAFLSKPFVITEILARVEAMLSVDKLLPILATAPATPVPLHAGL